jgi:hypothetical protein
MQTLLSWGRVLKAEDDERFGEEFDKGDDDA